MTLDKVIAGLKKEYGDAAVTTGGTVVECGRIPTGIFALDLITGGGVPRSRITEIYGIAGSGKSNCLSKLVASEQRLRPGRKCIWVAVEPYDPVWSAKFGVDNEALTVLSPEYSQQAVDMIEAVVSEPEVSLVVLDSFAAMSTQAELEKSAEEFDPGGSGRIGKLLFNKVMTRQRELEKQKHEAPTFVFINQMRNKVGVMFGSPESCPGGFAREHACALRLRLYAKGVKDPKVSKDIDARREIRAEIKKHKLPVVARECIFEMAVIPQPNLAIGQVNNWRTLAEYLERYSILAKDGKGYRLGQEHFATLSSIRDKIESDHALYDALSTQIIDAEKARIYDGINTVKEG